MAIEVQLIDIYSKPSDFKVCKACKRLNWYENETCINTDCTSNLFDERVKLKKLFQMNGFIGKMKRVIPKKKLIEFF